MKSRCHQLIAPVLAALLFCVPANLPVSAGVLAEATSNAQKIFPINRIKHIVAPIALFPDELLATMLLASAWPVDLILAANWLKDSAGLAGASAALANQPWHPSVKSLAAYAQPLLLLADNLDWTRDLEMAFYHQQPDTFAAIQSLRQQAHTLGHLSLSGNRAMVTANGDIMIQPVLTDYFLVPVYNPWQVYGNALNCSPCHYPVFQQRYKTPQRYRKHAAYANCDWPHRRIRINASAPEYFNPPLPVPAPYPQSTTVHGSIDVWEPSFQYPPDDVNYEPQSYGPQHRPRPSAPLPSYQLTPPAVPAMPADYSMPRQTSPWDPQRSARENLPPNLGHQSYDQPPIIQRLQQPQSTTTRGQPQKKRGFQEDSPNIW